MSDLYNPFPGLRPFESKESNLFFGRERHVNELIRKLEMHRFVSIVGNSGSGKSSLIRAGLLPAIVQKNPNWKIGTMRPGATPIENLITLFQTILQESNSNLNRNRCQELIERSDRGLIQLIRTAVIESPILILVDQFEELFRFGNTHISVGKQSVVQQFVKLILTAIKQTEVPIYVIITLRSDFLGECEQLQGLPEAINNGQFLVPRMNEEEIENSVKGPVKMAGGKISPQLIQKLIEETSNRPDQLPVMQHALMRTWNVWQNDAQLGIPMDIAHYEQIGGMQAALQKHAEEAYQELINDENKSVAKGIFQCLTFKETDNRGVRRPCSVTQIASILDVTEEKVMKVASIFRQSERGFIVPAIPAVLTGDSVLDISHESLMRVWKRLENWVQEEAQNADLYKRLTESALLFDQGKAGLWRDPDLQIAMEWKSKNRLNIFWASQYNGHFNKAMLFLEASENDKLFALADQKRRRVIIFSVLIFFLLALSFLSIWALYEKSNSNRNASLAIAQKNEADLQRNRAETNLIMAQEEERRVKEQKLETEAQRELAVKRAEEARVARVSAEIASAAAIEAREQAIADRKKAVLQKEIADLSFRKADSSEKVSKRLQMLSLAQNLAIRVQLTDGSTTEAIRNRIFLALYAHKYNEKYNGETYDPAVFKAMITTLISSEVKNYFSLDIHADDVKTISFNPKQEELLSSGTDGRLVISNYKNGLNAKLQFTQIDKIVNAVRYNPDGSLIAVSTDKDLLIYASDNMGKPLVRISNLHKEQIVDIQWDESEIISMALDGEIHWLDASKGNIIRSQTLNFRPTCFVKSQNKQILYIGSDQGKVYSLDSQEKNGVNEIIDRPNDKITCLSIGPKEEWICIGTASGFACIYPLYSSEISNIPLLGHEAGVNAISFHPIIDGLVATGSLDSKVRIWNINAKTVAPIVLDFQNSWIRDVQFDQEGLYLASASKDKTVMLYPISLQQIKERLLLLLGDKKQLSKSEWNTLIGSDIIYESL